MCRVFAGQDPHSYRFISRSVRLGGHATSIRLEAQFWDILDEMARVQAMSTPRFLSRLHDEALELHGELPNFASLLRNVCVLYLRQPAESLSQARAQIAAE